ncbi:MAG TPA: hypothetical protein EYO33_31615 [Phycisphaerales bacterium]|nr:hypothetical protein [Phycisphaerales bacterium]
MGREWSRGDYYRSILPTDTPLSKDGMPLYPDPALYPPEVLKDFGDWAELFHRDGVLAVRRVRPTESRLTEAFTLRRSERRANVLEKLGQPKLERWDFEDVFFDRYSEQVSLAYSKNTNLLEFISTIEEGAKKNINWDFVFLAGRTE